MKRRKFLQTLLTTVAVAQVAPKAIAPVSSVPMPMAVPPIPKDWLLMASGQSMFCRNMVETTTWGDAHTSFEPGPLFKVERLD